MIVVGNSVFTGPNAIKSAILSFYTILDNGELIPPDFNIVQTWAIGEVNRQAASFEGKLDNLVTSNPVRAIMLNTEIVSYYQQGRPQDPSANIYVIANSIALRRGELLRDTLERLFSKWRDIQASIAFVASELDRLIEEINNASTIEEIGIVLASSEL